jgi:TolB-like protein/DNA-binding winged helix-turn-helix (wHTH) protein/tetratricopeptide (TPR) repeat protein
MSAGVQAFSEQASADTTLRKRGVYAFGPFKLDPMRRTLHRDAVAVALPSRLFETLLYLVEHAERPVGRDELERAVWRGRVVEDGNLQRAVSSLRKALQTGIPGETYITTITGHGFQFTSPVSFEPFSSGAPAIVSAHDPISAHEQKNDVVAPPVINRSWHRAKKIQFAVVALLFAASVAIWRMGPKRSDELAFSPPAHSVAILPFVNMSGDSREDYFSDGLADELINTLSNVRGLRVAARTSAFSFKASTSTIGEIGRKLDVSTVLEGAVRRDGKRIHISVQLIDTRTGFQFWSRSYDRDRFFDDMLKLQTDIAGIVSASLETKLMQSDAARLTAGGTRNPQAFDAYLRGMSDSRQFGEPSLRQSIVDFSEAISLDPGYAQAFAGRAAAHNFLVVYGYETDATNGKQEAEAAASDADSAIGLAPTLADAHRVKSLVLFNALAFKGATQELAIARDLAPNDAPVESTFGIIQARLGHDEAAISAARHAIALDPLNPDTYERLGQALYWTRHFDEALEAFGHATALDKHPSRITLSWAASAYLAKGDPAAAERICSGGNGWTDDTCLAIAFHAMGRQDEADAKFARLHQAFGDRGAYVYAEICAQWGQPAEALRWLRTAYALHNSGLGEMKVSPFLDPIRNSTEFRDIEWRLNFPM